MDIIKFNNPTAPMRMEQGVIVNGLKSKMWVERYDKAGEFKFVADAKVGMRDALPIGSFISHLDTSEVMIVENHEISDKKIDTPEIIITGRGLETYLENRIVGSNKPFPSAGEPNEYPLAADNLSDQIVTLIQQHIYAVHLVDVDNQVPFVVVLNTVTTLEDVIARTVKRGPLYDRVLELLAIGSLGIKVVRPSQASPTNTGIVIHSGVDRTGEIIFSSDTGEIENADYLWSNKRVKNAALITGRWVETMVTSTETLYDRRMMLIDASDIDNHFPAAPEGADLDAVVAAMQLRGLELLISQRNVALTKAEVSRSNPKLTYRKDFDVGDFVTVHGSYNDSTTLRISEYVEIEDETGSTSYPTLTVI